MNHIGTHDTERAITRLAGENPDGHDRAWQFEHNTLSEFDYLKGISMMKIASLIQFTLPGVPSIYYGDEIGMQGIKKFKDYETPISVRAYKRLSMIYEKQGNYENAFEICIEAIKNGIEYDGTKSGFKGRAARMIKIREFACVMD